MATQVAYFIQRYFKTSTSIWTLIPSSHRFLSRYVYVAFQPSWFFSVYWSWSLEWSQRSLFIFPPGHEIIVQASLPNLLLTSTFPIIQPASLTKTQRKLLHVEKSCQCIYRNLNPLTCMALVRALYLKPPMNPESQKSTEIQSSPWHPNYRSSMSLHIEKDQNCSWPLQISHILVHSCF
jgi:hypothetical protein